MKENNHIYAIRYDIEIEAGGFTKDEHNGKGLCDALLLVSIIKPEDGSYSQMLLSRDGKEMRELTQEELFKVWSLLGVSLYDNGELKGWTHELVEAHAKIMREIVSKRLA
jgi:hypothetical protein